jgi:hypothetical protein
MKVRAKQQQQQQGAGLVLSKHMAAQTRRCSCGGVRVKFCTDLQKLTVTRRVGPLQVCAIPGLHASKAGSFQRAHLCRASIEQQHTVHTSSHPAAAIFCLVCCVSPQVRMIEAAKEKLQKDMRSGSSKNLAAMVSVQA